MSPRAPLGRPRVPHPPFLLVIRIPRPDNMLPDPMHAVGEAAHTGVRVGTVRVACTARINDVAEVMRYGAQLHQRKRLADITRRQIVCTARQESMCLCSARGGGVGRYNVQLALRETKLFDLSHPQLSGYS